MTDTFEVHRIFLLPAATIDRLDAVELDLYRKRLLNEHQLIMAALELINHHYEATMPTQPLEVIL